MNDFDLMLKDAERVLQYEIDSILKPRMRYTTPKIRCSAKETDDAFIVDVDLPGFKKEDITIRLKNQELTVSAKSDVKEETEYLFNERHGQYNRTFYVSKDITPQDISAKYENGVLTMTIKKPVKAEPEDNQIAID